MNGVAEPVDSSRSNPTTGANITTWTGQRQPRAAVVAYVRAMDIEGNWLYIGGSFIEDPGRRHQPDCQRQHRSSPALGRAARRHVEAEPHRRQHLGHRARRRARLHGRRVPPAQRCEPARPASGDHRHRQRATWCPASSRTSRTPTPSGSRRSWRSATPSTRAARSTSCTSTPRATTAFQRGHLTLRGGDFQSLAYTNGILYASNHCNNWNFSGHEHVVDTVGLHAGSTRSTCSAPTTPTTLEFLPEFQPNWTFEGEGPWEQFVDSTGCIWAGGDITRGYSSPVLRRVRQVLPA